MLVPRVILTFGAFTVAAYSTAQHSSRTYSLKAIDGHALPAVSNVSTGDTSWVHWGKLVLSPDGKATFVDSSIYSYHGLRAGGSMNTIHARYRLYGDSIELGSLRSCSAPCFEGWFGRISDPTLTLTRRSNPAQSWPVYTYHLNEVQ
jgi:hypothetical protein